MPRLRKPPLWSIAVAAAAIVGLAGSFTLWRASRALKQSAVEVRSEQEISAEMRPFVAPASIGFEIVSSPEVFARAAVFEGHLYIAGPSGLSEYDLAGNLKRQFMVGRDLPSSPLVAMTVAQVGQSSEPELVVGTASEGLLFFNGNAFRQLFPADAKVRAVTVLLPDSAGRLLVGTKERGVLLFDGKKIRQIHSTLSNLYVQALTGTEDDLWVGTLNQGLLHWHGGTTESFDEEKGLPDRQVQAIARAGEKTYVGTPLGVVEFDRGRPGPVVARGVLVTALLVHGETLFVGTEDQGVVRVPLNAKPTRLQGVHASDDSSTANFSEVQQFFDTTNTTYVLTRNGLYGLGERGPSWKEMLQPRPAVLSDRNISALAADSSEQLWIGYFDRGLDLLTGESRRVAHIEDAHVFCVNSILADKNSTGVAVATANGLVRIGPAGNEQQILTQADGLIADHVTDVAPYRGGLAVATPAGLTFLDSAGARSMYAFHGLVNNHAYALGVSGDDLLVGTLGGISVLDKEKVLVNYTAGSSGLKQNWVTAIAPVGDEWFVGTYGSGVMSLDGTGRFHSFDKGTAGVEINPNAILVTPRFVAAGTLGDGLYLYNRETSRWSVVHAGLPSQNVTAFTESHGFLYVGTDNGLVRIEEAKLPL